MTTEVGGGNGMTQRNGDTEDERRHAGDALRALG